MSCEFSNLFNILLFMTEYSTKLNIYYLFIAGRIVECGTIMINDTPEPKLGVVIEGRTRSSGETGAYKKELRTLAVIKDSVEQTAVGNLLRRLHGASAFMQETEWQGGQHNVHVPITLKGCVDVEATTSLPTSPEDMGGHLFMSMSKDAEGTF